MCLSQQDRAKSSVFSNFRNKAREAEERTASGRLFQTEVAAAEKALPPMVARTVRKMTSAVDDEERRRLRVQTSETRCSCLDKYSGAEPWRQR